MLVSIKTVETGSNRVLKKRLLSNLILLYHTEHKETAKTHLAFESVAIISTALFLTLPLTNYWSNAFFGTNIWSLLFTVYIENDYFLLATLAE